MASKYKVMAQNVWGLNNIIKEERITAQILQRRPEILFLQETPVKQQPPSPSFILKMVWSAIHDTGGIKG